MTSFRMSVTVLAVMHALFAGFTALVGAFANGGDVWQRLLVVLLHPLGAAGVLVLVLRPRLATTTILALVALLTANVVADLGLARLMATGRERDPERHGHRRSMTRSTRAGTSRNGSMGWCEMSWRSGWWRCRI